VSVGNINVTATLAKVEQRLNQDRSISPAVRGMIELLITIISLLTAKLGVNSSNSGIAPSKDPTRPRGAKPKSKRPLASGVVRRAIRETRWNGPLSQTASNPSPSTVARFLLANTPAPGTTRAK